MKNNSIKKLISIILATASVASMSIFSPASASPEKFINMNFNSLPTSIDKNKFSVDDLKKICKILDAQSKVTVPPKSSHSYYNRSLNAVLDNDLKNEDKSKKKNIKKFIKTNIEALNDVADHAPKFKDTDVTNHSSSYAFLSKLIAAHLNNIELKDFSVKHCLPTIDVYNDKMEEQLTAAMKDVKTVENVKKGDKLDVNMNFSNLTENSGNDTLDIPYESIRHIMVGSLYSHSDSSQNIPEDTLEKLSAAHTVFSLNGLKNIFDLYKENLKQYFGQELVNFYCDSTTSNISDGMGISCMEPTSISGGAKLWKLLGFMKNEATNKGIYPLDWGWLKIKDAIKNILVPTNLQYTYTHPILKNWTKSFKDPNNIKDYRQYAYFYGKYDNVPIFAIVDVDGKKLITDYPLSENEFNTVYKKDRDNHTDAKDNFKVYNAKHLQASNP